MKEPVDHEIKLRVSGSEWLALRRLADDDDRTMSGYIRRVLRDHLSAVSAEEAARDRDDEGPSRVRSGSYGISLTTETGGD